MFKVHRSFGIFSFLKAGFLALFSFLLINNSAFSQGPKKI